MQSLLPRSGHIVALDLLRGLAALSVCLFHLLGGDTLNHLPVIKGIVQKGYLGLDLFFIVSGFIIPYSMYMNQYSLKKFPRFMLKRSCRIEPPYIISFVLIVCMRFIHSALYDQLYIIDWKQFLLHFVYLNQYFGKDAYTIVYWTLVIEFQYYILIGLFFPLIMKRSLILSVTLFLAWLAVCWFVKLPYNFFIFQYGLVFLSGILIFLYKINRVTQKEFLVLLTVTLFLMYFKNGLDVVFTTLFANLVIFNLEKQWKVTNFLGMISFSLYLVHLEAAGWLEVYIHGYFTDILLLKFITIVFAITFATVFYYLFERPAFNLSKKLSYRDKKPA